MPLGAISKSKRGAQLASGYAKRAHKFKMSKRDAFWKKMTIRPGGKAQMQKAAKTKATTLNKMPGIKRKK